MDQMSQPVSTTRLLLLIAALTNPFCWLPCITVAQSAFANFKTGRVRGTAFVSDHNGRRSVVSGATVTLNGRSLSQQTVTDALGGYSFTVAVPGSYQIMVKAPGLVGSEKVTIASGAARDVPVQLEIEGTPQTVTVTATEPDVSKNRPTKRS
jgi:hypothetical protein